MSGQQAEILLLSLRWAASALIKSIRRAASPFSAMTRAVREMILLFNRFRVASAGSYLTQSSVALPLAPSGQSLDAFSPRVSGGTMGAGTRMSDAPGQCGNLSAQLLQ